MIYRCSTKRNSSIHFSKANSLESAPSLVKSKWSTLMKKSFFLYCILLASFTFSYCQMSKGMSNAGAKVKQGVCGTVVWKEGNQMPSPKRPQSSAKGVARGVVVYELTRLDQVESDGGFHRNIKTKLIKQVSSDSKGNFCLDLPEGQYSIFVWEDGKGLYANSFDGQSNIFPVAIRKGKVEPITITVDYRASY
jgi:hypothetical protein